MNEVCRFTFGEGIKKEWFESHLAWVIFNAESVYGKTQVRLAAKYSVSENQPCCVIDVGTEIGEHIARVFTGVMIRLLGEEQFEVRRISTNEDELLKHKGAGCLVP